MPGIIMSEIIDKNRITKLLQDELYHAKALLQTLTAELDAIKNRNLTALEMSLREKLACASNLEKIEKEISQYLAIFGFNPNTTKLDIFLNSVDKNSNTFDSILSELKIVAGECKHQNEINGRIVNSAGVSVRQALNIMTGQDSIFNGYSASGKSEDDSPQNSISIA